MLGAFESNFDDQVKTIVTEDAANSAENLESYDYNSCLEEADPDPASMPEFQLFEVLYQQ